MVASSSKRSRRKPEEHNLSEPLTSFVGRAREVKAIGESLRKTRLVTVTGPGGVGKSRVALEVARQQFTNRVDGLWFVELAPLSDSSEVAGEVARALGVTSAPRTAPLEALAGYLAERDVLIILDNCEHIIDGCADVAASLLTSYRGVRILATSRELLGVAGETVWRLEPLAADEAALLFFERGRQRRPELLPGGEVDATVATICERLDRLPLAIELSAAGMDMMGPAEILARLERHLPALEARGRFSEPRHRTLGATIEWSHDLLHGHEPAAFRSLAVFAGGFDADAAVSVAPMSLDVLGKLVDKSLVVVAPSSGNTARYRLLETVRKYALDQLRESGRTEAVRERHFRHFAASAHAAHAQWMSIGADRLDVLDADYDNVRAALEWSVDADPCAGIRLVGAARNLFFRLGPADGLRLAQVLLESCPARNQARVEALLGAGQLANTLVEGETARAALAEAHALSVELDEPVLEAWASFFLAFSDLHSGAIEPARRRLDAARKLHAKRGVRLGEARAGAVLGLTHVLAGEHPSATQLLDSALAVCVEEGDIWGQGQCHTFLGLASAGSPAHPASATSHFQEAAQRLGPLSDTTVLPIAIVGQASLLARSDPAAALRATAAASMMPSRVGAAPQPFLLTRVEEVRARCFEALGDDTESVWAAGARLGVEDAIALAFGTPRSRPESPSGLSARELEIAELVADGLTNKAIAARLQLSVRTIESHVRSALGKLGLANRTQLATWARDRVQ